MAKTQPEHGGDGAGQDVPRSRRRHAGIAAQVDENLPVGAADQRVRAFQNGQRPEPGRSFLDDGDAVGLHFGCRPPGQAGHLAGMRGENRRRLSIGEGHRLLAKRRDAVAVDQQRLAQLGSQLARQLLRFRVQRQSGAEHHEINALGKLQQGRLVAEGDAAGGRFLLRREDDFWPLVGQEGRHGGRGSEARIAAAGFQERHGGQVWGAIITTRSGDEQRVAERALVALRVARRQRQGVIDGHLQTGRLDHGRREGEGREVQGAAVPKAGPQQVAALGQAEGDGEVGPHRGAQHRAGVAVHAGGYVEAQHGLAAAVDPLDDLVLQTRHGTG